MTKQRKLAIVAKNPIVYHAPLYKEITAHGIDLEVLYLDEMGVGNLTDTEFKITITWDVPLLEGYRYRFLRNWSPFRYGGFLARINPGIFLALRAEKYDAVLVTGYDTLSCWLTMLAAKLSDTPVIWRGEAILRSPGSSSGWKEILKKEILNRFFRSCDAVMFSCSGNKEYLRFYQVPESKLFPIPCAVDNDFFRKERAKYIEKVDELRNQLEIPSDDFVILFSARFTQRKRPLDLMRAVDLLPHKNVTLLFVGDGIEREVMHGYAKENGIKAIFVGFINQGSISKFYCMADVAVVISEYDPSPKALNEAMNFELPIIASNALGTSTDLVKHGENGFIVDVGDVNAIAQHLDWLVKNSDKARQMGLKSYEIVQKWTFSDGAEGVALAMDFVADQY